MPKYLLVIAACLMSSAAVADRPESDNDRRGPRSTITVSIAGLACTTAAGTGAFAARSWSWGASNTSSSSGGGSGGGAGRADFQNLAVTKAFDGCSPALLGGVATGRHFATLTLTQADAAGAVVARVELRDVFVAAWTVGGTTRDSSPDESVSFSFDRVQITSGGSTFCYDLRLARNC